MPDKLKQLESKVDDLKKQIIEQVNKGPFCEYCGEPASGSIVRLCFWETVLCSDCIMKAAIR